MKTAELCGKCAAMIADAYDVRRVAGGRDCKVTCAQCGKRRYGGTFEVRRKVRK